jgi:YVTN family beta-propeller protein
MRLWPRAVALGALLELTAACSRSLAAESREEQVFISNEDSGDITVLQASTGKLLGTIPVGKRPRGLRVATDGSKLYVALSGSPKGGPNVDETQLPPPDRAADGIGVVQLAERRLERVLPSGADPETFDIVGKNLVVSNEDTGQAAVVGLVSGKVERSLPVGGEPEGVTARPDGRVVYVTSEADHEVAVIDPVKQRVLTRFAVGKRPRSIAFSADGAHAYVTNELSGSVSVVDAQRHRVLHTIDLSPPSSHAPAARPMGIVVARDGEHAYVTTGRGRSVVELELRGNTVTRTLTDVGARPWGIAMTEDGKRLYVANGPSNDVAVIDTEAWRGTARIPVGRSPWGVAIARSAAAR